LLQQVSGTKCLTLSVSFCSQEAPRT